MAGSKTLSKACGDCGESSLRRIRSSMRIWAFFGAFAVLVLPCLQLSAREKNGIQYGMGLIVNVPFSERDVEQVLQDVVDNGIIRGTKEYNKDEYVSGAIAASSTKVFPAWTDGGRVFYKVRLNALDPRNFKDSTDVGTLAVRYVVKAQSEKNCVLQINAIFMEDFRKVAHASDGSVEGAEYKDIHDRLEAVESIREAAAEAQKVKDAIRARKQQEASSSSSKDTQYAAADVSTSNTALNAASSGAFTGTSAGTSAGTSNRTANSTSSGSTVTAPAMVARNVDMNPPPEAAPAATRDGRQTPEEHLKDLQRQVERLVKSPGAPLKSAPFHSASTLQSLHPGTEVLIVVSTTYWVGVETHDGQHGWMLRDQLEQLP
jgi:hypothetical protein